VSRRPPQPGDLIADRYELEELVGTGGMSTVFRAHDLQLERRVAIKILHEHYAADPEYLERFRREAVAPEHRHRHRSRGRRRPAVHRLRAR